MILRPTSTSLAAECTPISLPFTFASPVATSSLPSLSTYPISFVIRLAFPNVQSPAWKVVRIFHVEDFGTLEYDLYTVTAVEISRAVQSSSRVNRTRSGYESNSSGGEASELEIGERLTGSIRRSCERFNGGTQPKMLTRRIHIGKSYTLMADARGTWAKKNSAL